MPGNLEVWCKYYLCIKEHRLFQVGGCTEDQRVLILQQLQLLAQQGDNQAAAAFSNLGGDMATMIPSSPQVVV